MLDLLLHLYLLAQVLAHLRPALLELTCTLPFTVPVLLVHLPVDFQHLPLPVHLDLLQMLLVFDLVTELFQELRLRLRLLDPV